MENLIIKTIKKYRNEIINFSDELFNNPELGYKEFKTKKLIIEELSKYDIYVEKEYLETGFQVSLGSESPHIGLIAELDAIPTKDHPCASKLDNAAHTCGHSTQVAIMTYVVIVLKELNYKGKITLFYTPAEEYTDLDYRNKLIKENKIKFIGGKTNMLEMNLFDGVECVISLHSMGSEYDFGYNSSLAGFKYKKITFIGKAVHAAISVEDGINALNMFTLFNSGLGMLRETIKDNNMTRIHGILTKGGDTINSVPSEVVYECYIRSLEYDEIEKISNKLDTIAKHCSYALGGDCKIETQDGYKPLKPNRALSNVIYKNILKFTSEDRIIKDEKSIASGDIGDVSYEYPTTQFGYGGFKGSFHGKDFKIEDNENALIKPVKIVVLSIYDLYNDKNLMEEIKIEKN